MRQQLWLSVFLLAASSCDRAASPRMRAEGKTPALAPIEIKLADGRIFTLQPYAEVLDNLSWSRQTLAEECRRSLLENFPAFGTIEVLRQGTNIKKYFPLDYFGQIVFRPERSSPPPLTWHLAQERAGVNLWLEAVIPPGGIRDYPPMRGGDMVEISLCGVRLVANRTGVSLPLREDRIYHFDCEPSIFMNLLYPIDRRRIIEQPLLWGFRFEPRQREFGEEDIERALKPLIVAWCPAGAEMASEPAARQEEKGQ